jgi:hypothetical protein
MEHKHDCDSNDGEVKDVDDFKSDASVSVVYITDCD